MDARSWRSRISHRADISSRVVHLTKPNQDENLTALEVLMKILTEQTIQGSGNKLVSGVQRGFICGNAPVVCFQDVPLFSLSENIMHEQDMCSNNTNLPIRYRPFGLRFDKRYVFRNGGRPVLYENTDTAKSFLPQNEYWRIVKLDLNDDENIIDWTHEREWRIKGDFKFELAEAEILLSEENSLKSFYNYCEEHGTLDILQKVGGIITLKSLLF